ncbi:carboxypeptidase-like regulatory domain-containing protein [Ulvibacter antarcticus]|uniref:Carboxypeptidase-like protein n=1 Tax=Ulvibacter antarcticus TaxID=442714 RepID=A0A3L9YH58_9FLAO|nr:carboxypeptidase-like regulatory domain-containing protein [Ulvibacter antarcticus]RMA58897.1 carboxypeptidase-like protein [Ulvibacter antarcticus]
MKKTIKWNYRILIMTVCIALGSIFTSIAQELTNFSSFSGIVQDSNDRSPLESASIIVKNSNISVTTNSEGNFIIKIPEQYTDGSIIVSFLGYSSKEITITSLSKENNKIMLVPKITNLSEVNLVTFKNVESFVRTVFRKKTENNPVEPNIMTAFYRETVKRRSRNVSLTEAVVSLYKQPYNTNKKDIIELNKARKSTDYRRLDTVAFKLQGGPFSTLFIDIMKYPEYIFAEEYIADYDFKFEPPTTIKGKYIYVVGFKQKETITVPLYEGTLFIDSETLALTSANYHLNVEDSQAVEKMLVKKKPSDVRVYPLLASYHVDYRENKGKWYYSYGNIELTFKISQKGKWFSSVYSLASEMAVTDWELNLENKKVKSRERLSPTVIMSDEVSGFADPDFWGAYNVIEPEKSIESAISKIQRKIEKEKD